MAHCHIFRDHLALAYPAFGYAMWDPDPGTQSPPVEVGDVGIIRNGKFHRLLNALLPANHPSHESYGVPVGHEALEPPMRDHIDYGRHSPGNFCNNTVTILSDGFQVLATGSIGSGRSAEVSFLSNGEHGAALSLPLTARRADTLARGQFRKWIIMNIDSVFDFARNLDPGVKMEDIVLVTGCHRTRSWANTAFTGVQEDAGVSLGVEVAGPLCSNVNWRVSGLIEGAVIRHCPNGEALPEDQCIFIRGFRVKRTSFKILQQIKAAAEHGDDSDDSDDSDSDNSDGWHRPEKEVVPIPSETEHRDPLHILLGFITQRALAQHDCDMAVVHDDDLKRIMGFGSRTSLEALQPTAIIDYLESSKPEIGVISEYFNTNDQSPRTDTKYITVAMLAEQLNSSDPPPSTPFRSYNLTPSEQVSDMSGSGRVTEVFGTSIGDIVKTIERFRILVVGRSGVGKSSLINYVFGINDARVAHHKPGESDIQQEFLSQENQYFVLHDSKGFETGDLSNLETVRSLLQQRSQKNLPPRDRIHGLWLCVETPSAGGRVFEQGDELLLKFAHEVQVPVVIVFTQYDRLERSKRVELRADNRDMDEFSLRNQSVREASNVFDDCLKSLRRAMFRLAVPMPHCVKVSVRPGYQDSVSALVEDTRDVVRERLIGDAWIMWAIAQRASPSVKIDACISKGMSYNHYPGGGGTPGSGPLLLRDCLKKVHRDIITCWNFKGEVLNSKEFELLMLLLFQDVQAKPRAYCSHIEMINQFVTLVTPAAPIEPLHSTLGLTPNFLQWFSTAVVEDESSFQRFLVTYTVDLVSVLRNLFDITPTATWDGLRGAYGAYERSGSRQRIHDSIFSNIARGGHPLSQGDLGGMVRGIFVA